MKLALFTAAVGGDNAGDALIESAVTRLVGADEVVRLPLGGQVTDAHIAAANAADAALICGTNLYQSRFACGLTERVVAAIRVPLIPLGVGTSAPIGEIPVMDAAGTAAVRAIHARCRVGSVRDRASLRFLRSIGVRNVELTGCPVLFHGLTCPDFRPSGEGYTLAPRARLLHVDPRWQQRQSELLHMLARHYRPRLVLQSPYDRDEAGRLAERYGLDVVSDPDWQAAPYIEAAQQQRLSVGFRLHFAMLSMAYGKPALLIGHDSRSDEFARLVGLPPMHLQTISDALLGLKIDAVDFPADRVRRRWSELAERMAACLQANGLPCRLEIDRAPRRALRQRPLARKPRVAVLVDTPGWAYDNAMRGLRKALAKDFRIDIAYRDPRLRLDPRRYDLLHVCFWGEESHRNLGFPPERIVKEVSSHRWQHTSAWGPIPAGTFAERWLGDCATVITTSRRLKVLIEPETPARMRHTPNGIDARRFGRVRRIRSGPLVYGWAGNGADPAKRLEEIVVPACAGRKLIVARGEIGPAAMPAFYAGIDVYLVASAHEGEPLTLIEAMAAGSFPVCTDVGIVPELIRDGDNGLIVRDPSVAGFRRALDWCEAHIEQVRAAGRANAATMARERDWAVCSQFFARAYKEALARVLAPRFRNDDVAPDTSLGDLARFSSVFRKYGLTQVHGVCLNGRCNAAFRYDGDAVEYEGYPSLSKLPNGEIRRLAQGSALAERRDLVAWLDASPDEVALHGLYHTDYAAMSAAEQELDIAEGLRQMRWLFPRKQVRYFIAPFNRTNADTYRIAARHGLEVLAGEGVHLEEAVHRDALVIEPGQWHRYHHHRFHPQSAFATFTLSIDALDRALGLCISTQPPALDLDVAAPHGDRLAEFAGSIKARLRRSPLARPLRRLLAMARPREAAAP